MTTPNTTAELPSTGTLNITIRCEFTPGPEEIFRDCEIKIVHEAFKWVMESSSLFGAPEFRFDVQVEPGEDTMSMLHICDWDEEADGYHLKIGFDFEQLEDTRRALDELSRTSD